MEENEKICILVKGENAIKLKNIKKDLAISPNKFVNLLLNAPESFLMQLARDVYDKKIDKKLKLDYERINKINQV